MSLIKDPLTHKGWIHQPRTHRNYFHKALHLLGKSKGTKQEKRNKTGAHHGSAFKQKRAEQKETRFCNAIKEDESIQRNNRESMLRNTKKQKYSALDDQSNRRDANRK